MILSSSKSSGIAITASCIKGNSESSDIMLMVYSALEFASLSLGRIIVILTELLVAFSISPPGFKILSVEIQQQQRFKFLS